MDSHKADPKPSLLKPPAQSERPLLGDITFDGRLIQGAKNDPGGIDEFDQRAGLPRRISATAVRNSTRATGATSQLLLAARLGARLAERRFDPAGSRTAT